MTNDCIININCDEPSCEDVHHSLILHESGVYICREVIVKLINENKNAFELETMLK